MDEFVEIFENFIKQANNAVISKIPTKWKECVELRENGWVIEDYLEVPNSDDIVIRWKKEASKTDTRISFSDQISWLNYLEKHKKEKFYAK